MNIYSLPFLLLLLSPTVFSNTDSQQKLNKKNAGVANIVFKSADGGQTWQDISEGLPGNLAEATVHEDAFFANNSGVYLRAANGIYQSKPNSTAPFWKKESSLDKLGSIAPGKAGM